MFSIQGCDLFNGNNNDDNTENRNTGSKGVSDALEELRNIREEVAKEAGNDAIALRSFQAVNIGDVFILNEEDRSIQNYTHNIEDITYSELEKEATESEALQNLDIEFELTRGEESDFNVGLNLVDYFVKSAFSYAEVMRIKVRVSVTDPAIERLKFSTNYLSNYYTTWGINSVPGNVVVSEKIAGRVRIEYSLFNEASQEIDVGGSLVVDSINTVSAGYANQGMNNNYTSFVQESNSKNTIFAIKYTKIPNAYIDELQIKRNLYGQNFTEENVNNYLELWDTGKVSYEIIRAEFEGNTSWYINTHSLVYPRPIKVETKVLFRASWENFAFQEHNQSIEFSDKASVRLGKISDRDISIEDLNITIYTKIYAESNN